MSRNCSMWCRSLLLSFSTCYLGTLGLEGAISCILVRTSYQRTTSEKRTKALLPTCPLHRGSTVYDRVPDCLYPETLYMWHTHCQRYCFHFSMNQLLRRPYQKMFKTDQRTCGNSLLVSLVCGVQ